MITLKLTEFEADAVENALRSYIPLASSRGLDVYQPVEALVRLMKARWGLASELEATGNPFMLLDENGNVCGSVEYQALKCGVCKGTGRVGRRFNVCLACLGKGR